MVLAYQHIRTDRGQDQESRSKCQDFRTLGEQEGAGKD